MPDRNNRNADGVSMDFYVAISLGLRGKFIRQIS